MLWLIYTDSYDGVVCSGSFTPGLIKAECIQEMYDLAKPGQSLLPHFKMLIYMLISELEYQFTINAVYYCTSNIILI